MAQFTSGKSASQPEALCDQIVVGVGGSERSMTALEYGLLLARAANSQAEAIIVNEIHVSLAMTLAHGDTLERLMTQAEAIAERETKRIADRIREMAHRCGTQVAVSTEQGYVVDALTDASARATLAVIGKRGLQSDQDEGLMGPNAELFVKRTNKPVLLTPSRFEQLERVVVAFGAKAPGSTNLRSGAALAQYLQIPLCVVTVQPDDTRACAVRELAEQELDKIGATADYEMHVGDPASGLLAYSTPNAIIVVGPSGRSRLSRFILGNVTEEVMREAQGPVLITAKLSTSDAE